MEATRRHRLPEFFALAVVPVLMARVYAENRRVVTVEVEDVLAETSGYGESPEARFNLSEPVPLEGVSVIWVDAEKVRVERDVSGPTAEGTAPGADGFTGAASVYDSEGQVVAWNPDMRVVLSNRAAPAEFVQRYPVAEGFSRPHDFDPRVDPGFEGTATSFGISLRIIPVQAGGGDSPRSRLEGFHDGSVKLHFVYGIGGGLLRDSDNPFEIEDNPATHSFRTLNVTPITAGPASVSDWESYFFEIAIFPDPDNFPLDFVLEPRPVYTDNLRLVTHDAFGLGGGGDEGGIMTELQLILNDGSFVPLDDSGSPSTGELVPGRVSLTNSLLVEGDQGGGALDGRRIIGLRWRVHNAGAQAFTAATRPPEDGGTRFFSFYSDTPLSVEFLRGDGNDDGTFDISDPVFNLEFQFLGKHDPGCLAALDTNGDTELDISDPVYSLEHQFLGEPAPPAPYPGCGPESLPPEEALGCERQPESCP